MKAVRSSESVRIRRELAQLLRRLRAIRREKLSDDELADRVKFALTEAGSIRQFVAITNAADMGGAMCRTCLGRVDKRTLSEWGLGRQRGKAIRPSEETVASSL